MHTCSPGQVEAPWRAGHQGRHRHPARRLDGEGAPPRRAQEARPPTGRHPRHARQAGRGVHQARWLLGRDAARARHRPAPTPSEGEALFAHARSARQPRRTSRLGRRRLTTTRPGGDGHRLHSRPVQTPPATGISVRRTAMALRMPRPPPSSIKTPTVHVSGCTATPSSPTARRARRYFPRIRGWWSSSTEILRRPRRSYLASFRTPTAA